MIMAHLHSVYDTDSHFSINAITRAIKNESSTKTKLIQFDHNSERFTFEIPKLVEGHDMTQCNKIEIHYINIDNQTNQLKTGVYEVDDMQISPESEDVVIFSWLISQNGTQLVGSLNFLIRFSCVQDDGTIDYAWNTAIFSGISISNGIYNTGIIVEQYADVLEQWKKDLEEAEKVSPEELAEAVSNYIDNVALGDVVKSSEDTVTQGHLAAYSDSTGRVIHETSFSEDEVENAIRDISKLSEEKVDLPKDLDGEVTHGTVDQILATNADGTTKWVDKSAPTDEQVASAVNDYVTENPDVLGNPTDEQVQTAVDNYLVENPVTAGASEEEAKQIEENKSNIENLSANSLTKTYFFSETIPFDKFYIIRLVDGFMQEVTTYGRSTDYIDISKKKGVSISTKTANTHAMIAFYDKDKNYLKDISVVGAGKVVATEIDLSIEQYSDAVYMIVSAYGTDVNDDYVSQNCYCVFTCEYDLEEKLSNKLDKNLGTENKEKILTIDENGYVVPTEQKQVDVLKGRDVLVFGDSITYTHYLETNDNGETTNYTLWGLNSSSFVGDKYYRWPVILDRKHEFRELRNYARSGASIRSTSSTLGLNLEYQVAEALKDLDNPHNAFATDDFNPDIVIFAIGTNDNSVQVSDTLDSALNKFVYDETTNVLMYEDTVNALTERNIHEMLCKALLQIKHNFPYALTLFITPPNARGKDSLYQVRNAIKNVCDYFGVDTLNGSVNYGINTVEECQVGGAIKGIYLQDGLHPNGKAQNLLARCVDGYLQSHYMPLNDSSIFNVLKSEVE